MEGGSGFHGEPVAYFLTLAGYGTRLHGDERGTVDRRHNTPGEPPLLRDDFRSGYARHLLISPPMVFGEAARRLVEATFVDTCAHRGWSLLAVHCRTNHVHAVVISAESVSVVMHRLKARTTVALREGGLVDRGQQIWARHGSTRYLWSEEDVAAACEYTMEAQGNPLPGTGEWRPYA